MNEYGAPPQRPVVSISRPVLTPLQEQEKWLAEGIRAVTEKAATMRGCMAAAVSAANSDAARASEGDADPFMTVVHAASRLFDELRTNALAPHNYYELYMKAFDEVQSLQQFFEDECVLRRRPLEDMYERVQYVGHIVPRLYLLIMVGAAYITHGDQPVLDLLQDLVEMCKGVQHPTRGLFLRHFLLTTTKHKLPGDMNRAAANGARRDGGTARDTARLLIQNAKEMNWLWIRMEAKWYGKAVQGILGGATGKGGSNAAVARRTRDDRRELCVLVGMNVVRVSQLDGIDRAAYQKDIFPQLMSVVLNYREPLAQQYLFEVIVQVFPDEYHLFTLEPLLDSVKSLTATVDVCEVLRSLMDRLGNYVLALRDGTATVSSAEEKGVIDNLFATFLEKLESMPVSYATKGPELLEIKRSSSAPPVLPIMLGTYVNAMASLARMAARVSPASCDEQISAVLQCVAEKFAAAPPLQTILQSERADATPSNSAPSTPIAQAAAAGAPAIVPAAQTAAEKLVTSAIEQVKDVNRILGMEGLTSLLAHLSFSGRRAAALAVCESALRGGDSQRVTTLDAVARLLELLDPLLCDQDDAPADVREIYPYDPVGEFEEEQQTVCRILHLVDSADPVTYTKMLNGIRKLLGQGGTQRIRYTFPALAALLVKAALRLHVAIRKNSSNTAAGAETAVARHADPAAGDDDGEAQEKSPATAAAAATVTVAVDDTQKKTQQLSKQLAKIFSYLHSGDGQGILELWRAQAPTAALFGYLTVASAADTCGCTDVCYDLYATEVFRTYEENSADTRDQVDMLVSIVNSLYALRNMSADNYAAIAAKACRCCSKVVRQQDQSRLVALCANLFAKRCGRAAGSADGATRKKPTHSDPAEAEQPSAAAGADDSAAEDPRTMVLECLQRALRTAKQIATPIQQLSVYVDLLNIFLHFFASKTVQLEAPYINDLLDSIRELSEAQRCEPSPAALPTTTTASQKEETIGDAGGDGESTRRSERNDGDADDSDDDADPVSRLAKDKLLGRGARGSSAASSPTPAGSAVNPQQQQQSSSSPAVNPAVTAAAYAAIRQIYRCTTKYIRTRQSVDPRWEQIEV